ncbi:peroxiredoxin [Candidatus Woesearchaeota archaeon CG10_big_fil_rev_8_21_14_0_10_37_12]|nr:MAG: peroxiredoxin [Candidatus Woesearchaeota archaeon CG10_big_fil_rev_8_21_14_0_10_37_12]
MNTYIGKQAPEFHAEAYHTDAIQKIDLKSYKGKWVVLLFYPADFTFICPTELGEFADHYDEFTKINTEVLAVSTDTAFVHKAWHDNSETIKKIKFPMIADPTRKICIDYGTLIEEEGLSLRCTVIIDPDGNIKSYDIHDNSIGRSVHEVLRRLQAAQFVAENPGQVCPASWKPGGKTLKPGLDLVGKI